MLRERDDDPERRLEVVHVDVEGRVGLVAEAVLVLGEALLEVRAVHLGGEHLLAGLLPVYRVPVGQIHLSERKLLFTSLFFIRSKSF